METIVLLKLGMRDFTQEWKLNLFLIEVYSKGAKGFFQINVNLEWI